MTVKGIPRVSVLIDTYNHERFIERAILSVLEQDMPMDDVEILVVDDDSTDRTPVIIRRFEPRVRLIRKPNGGQASAFNVGIPECRGEIVAFLDGDDWWAPQKLRKVVEAMAKTKREPKIVSPEDVDPHHDWSRPLMALGSMAVDFEQRVDFRRLHTYRLGWTR